MRTAANTEQLALFLAHERLVGYTEGFTTAEAHGSRISFFVVERMPA